MTSERPSTTAARLAELRESMTITEHTKAIEEALTARDGLAASATDAGEGLRCDGCDAMSDAMGQPALCDGCQRPGDLPHVETIDLACRFLDSLVSVGVSWKRESDREVILHSLVGFAMMAEDRERERLAPATDAGEGREALVKRLREAAHEAVGFALSEALSGNAIAVSLIAENTRRLLDAAEKDQADD